MKMTGVVKRRSRFAKYVSARAEALRPGIPFGRKRLKSKEEAQKSGLSLLKTTTLVSFWSCRLSINSLNAVMTLASHRLMGGLEIVMRLALHGSLMHDCLRIWAPTRLCQSWAKER